MSPEFSEILRPTRRVRAAVSRTVLVIERIEAADWVTPDASGTDYVGTLHSAYDVRTGERVA